MWTSREFQQFVTDSGPKLTRVPALTSGSGDAVGVAAFSPAVLSMDMLRERCLTLD